MAKKKSCEKGIMRTLGQQDAILVVDAQVKFTQRDMPHSVAGADELIERINGFVDIARERGARIIWIRRTARPGVGPGRHSRTWFGDAIDDLYREDLVAIDPRLKLSPDDVVLDKPRHSAFYETDLESVLRNLEVDRVVITGLTTNVCCLATAVDAVARDLDVVFLRDLTAALPIVASTGELSPDSVHDSTLALVEYAFGTVALAGDVI